MQNKECEALYDLIVDMGNGTLPRDGPLVLRKARALGYQGDAHPVNILEWLNVLANVELGQAGLLDYAEYACGCRVSGPRPLKTPRKCPEHGKRRRRQGRLVVDDHGCFVPGKG